MPHPIRTYQPAFAERAVAEARAGLSRAEIAAALGASLADFEAWAATHAAFAAALADADTVARAWWDEQPRAALNSGKLFKATAWAKAMAQRYGRSADRPPAAKAARPPPRVAARVELPDNGRERRPPPRRNPAR